MPTNGHPSPSVQKRPRGRPFAKGNGGRKLGARNRASLLADALPEGEQEALIRKGDRARQGRRSSDAQVLFG